MVSCVNTLSIQKINQHRTENNEEMFDFIIKKYSYNVIYATLIWKRRIGHIR